MAEHEIKAGNTTYKVTGASNRTEAGAAVFDHMVGNLAVTKDHYAEERRALRAAEATRNYNWHIAMRDAQQILVHGLQLYNNGNYAGALKEFKNALSVEYLDLTRWEPNIHILIGRAYTALGNYDNAIAEISYAESIVDGNLMLCEDFRSADGFYERAIAYNHKNDYDNVIADCTTAIYLRIEKPIYSTGKLTANLDDLNDSSISAGGYLGEENWYNDEPALALVYFLRANAYIKKGDWSKAAADLREAAALKNKDAQKTLDDNASQIAAADSAAKTQYQNDLKSANAGDAEACYRVGYCNEHGIGVSKNKEEAIKWYQTAADEEHTAAMRQLGLVSFDFTKGYVFKSRNDKNNIKALQLLKKAADNSDELATRWLRNDDNGQHFTYDLRDEKAGRELKRLKKVGGRIGALIGAIICGVLFGLIGLTGVGVMTTVMLVVAGAATGAFIGFLCGRGWNFFVALFIFCVLCFGLYYGANYIGKRTGLFDLNKIGTEQTQKESFQTTTGTIIGSSHVSFIMSKPSNNSSIVKNLNEGDKVTITGKINGNWYPVEHEGAKGWVYKEYIQQDE